MADKSVLFVIDSFSDKVLDHENVTLYDYGVLIQGDYHTGENLVSSIGFHKVTKDDGSNGPYSYENDQDIYEEYGSLIYEQFSRTDQNPESYTPHHGDWVVEAIAQTLDDPSRTELICIDLDHIEKI